MCFEQWPAVPFVVPPFAALLLVAAEQFLAWQWLALVPVAGQGFAERLVGGDHKPTQR